ncbi:hypothetical protein [Cupriavidus pauculus]|uniref:hypothetical protein n=1 Tax=Cupriavidus pauculus TaxID=82633 RepID=UPI001EE1FBA0|nr:hypothetical protein [Cupriavidus pauculus]GJG95037.1 hypothetical protein CBA19C6_11130 [Cupriavidus pauculus]
MSTGGTPIREIAVHPAGNSMLIAHGTVAVSMLVNVDKSISGSGNGIGSGSVPLTTIAVSPDRRTVPIWVGPRRQAA